MKVKPNFTPTEIFKKTPSCRLLISNIIKELMEIDDANAHVKGGVYTSLDTNDDSSSGLKIHFETQDLTYFQNLIGELNRRLGSNIEILRDQEKFKITEKSLASSSTVTTDATNICVIPHELVGKFLMTICHIWKIEDKNVLRDLYCHTSGKEKGMNVPESDKEKYRKLFDKYHAAYSYNKELDSMACRIKASVIGTFFYASIISKTSPYELINAVIHASHLSEQENKPENIDKRQSSFRSEVADRKSKLLFLNGGDIFAEMAAIRETDNTVVVSPDNQFRCGSAALYGNLGTVEECLSRVTDYVIKGSEAAVLPDNDPMKILIHDIMKKIEPNPNKTLLLSHHVGVNYMTNQEIPEYIAETNVSSYINMVYTLLMNEANHRNYARHKADPVLVENVSFLKPDGIIQKINILGMVGIDGREESSFNFSKGETARGEYYDKSGTFDRKKAEDYYYRLWEKAFEKIDNMNPKATRVILNAVGAGAFDPSKSGEDLTQAGAIGFGKALTEYLIRQKSEDTLPQIIFPFYPKNDPKSVYFKYQQAFINEAKLSNNALATQLAKEIQADQSLSRATWREQKQARQEKDRGRGYHH